MLDGTGIVSYRCHHVTTRGKKKKDRNSWELIIQPYPLNLELSNTTPWVCKAGMVSWYFMWDVIMIISFLFQGSLQHFPRPTLIPKPCFCCMISWWHHVKTQRAKGTESVISHWFMKCNNIFTLKSWKLMKSLQRLVSWCQGHFFLLFPRKLTIYKRIKGWSSVWQTPLPVTERLLKLCYIWDEFEPFKHWNTRNGAVY